MIPFRNGNDNIEIAISLNLLNIDPNLQENIRIAFKLSDPADEFSYWPEKANIEKPDSWGLVGF